MHLPQPRFKKFRKGFNITPILRRYASIKTFGLLSHLTGYLFNNDALTFTCRITGFILEFNSKK